MRVKKCRDDLRIEANKYTLVIDRAQMLARLYVRNASLYYHMCLASAIDQVGRSDTTIGIKSIRIQRRAEYMLVKIAHSSSLWAEKHTFYRCYADSLEYYIVVRGKGKVDRAYFFRGRVGQNELASIPGFTYFFPACPNFLEKDYFHASEYCNISAGQERFAWGLALSSGPLCFAFANDFKPPWLSVGIAAKEGQYGFQSFEYNYKPKSVAQTHDSIVGTQAFSLAYYGHLKVNGVWETPHLVFNFSRDKYSSIKKYVNWLFEERFIQKPRRATYPWWTRPIFCGWHEQVAVGFGSPGREISRQYLEAGAGSFAACTQKNYEKWLGHLGKNKIRPGIVIIDALWQRAVDVNKVDKKKWPDLRGFIDKCHRNGQKVLLWLDCYKRGRAPVDECITIDGKPICCDPTNPQYVKRLQQEITTMLSDEPGCYNADGFKVDGTWVPCGYGMKTFADLYGFELKKDYLRTIYEHAKTVKKDALINLFVANPYFLDVCDMVRAGDMYTVKGDPCDSLKKRWEIIKIGMPGMPVDTDGQFRFSMEPSFAKLIKQQVALGVPTIYNAEQVLRLRTFSLPITGKLSKQDYHCIAGVFDRYVKGKTGNKPSPLSNG